MKRTVLFAAACAGAIGVLLLVMVFVVQDATVRRALAVSAAVAFVVQCLAFLAARGMAQRKNVMAGWGIGIALRFGALVLFALVVVPTLGLPLSASLLGLATFLFVSTLIEPLFLKT